MVLENATASDPSYSDNLPSSDIDPYASGNPPYTDTKDPSLVRVSPQSSNVYINLNELPRRWSLIGTKPHPQILVDGVQDQVRFATNILQRPVTQDEANAFAFHFAKSLRIASYGTPVGVVFGTAMAYRTQKDWKFPGWSPFKEGSRFSKDVFGPLKGQMARTAWQLTRVSAYWLVGATVAQIFFGSYALSVSLAGRAMDPRLKDFTKALQQRQQSGLGREATGQVGNESAGPKGMETYDMARQRRDAQERFRRRPASAGQADDASPTGSMFSDEYMDAPGSSSFLSEEEVRQQAEARLRPSREPSQQSSYEQSASASRQSTADESSPRADRQESPRQSGSAWDRLRQTAMSGEQSRTFRGSQPSESAGSRAPARGGDNVSTGDSFSFSSSDQDRQLGKSQAQKDFDAMLEREREGRDGARRR